MWDIIFISSGCVSFIVPTNVSHCNYKTIMQTVFPNLIETVF